MVNLDWRLDLKTIALHLVMPNTIQRLSLSNTQHVELFVLSGACTSNDIRNTGPKLSPARRYHNGTMVWEGGTPFLDICDRVTLPNIVLVYDIHPPFLPFLLTTIP